MRTTRWIVGAGLRCALTGVAFARGPGMADKVRAPFVPNDWRTVTPAPETWSLDDCRNMGQMVGASAYQVACSFETVQPGQISKFILGGATPIESPPSSANVPSPNCGW